jgi:hypothetical protein
MKNYIHIMINLVYFEGSKMFRVQEKNLQVWALFRVSAVEKLCSKVHLYLYNHQPTADEESLFL